MVTSTLIIVLPDFTKTFEVEIDTSDCGIGLVWMKDGRPIAFFSKGFGIQYKAMSTYEKELLGIVLSVNKWRSYLPGSHFKILTDHHCLK